MSEEKAKMLSEEPILVPLDDSDKKPQASGQPQGGEIKVGEEVKMEYDLMNNQLEEIRKEIEENSPLISEVVSLLNLAAEFKDNPPFLCKIQNLEKKFKNYRTVRRDGSCFYRAYFFSIFEHIVLWNDEPTLALLEKKLLESKDYLIKVGYEAIVLEDFLDGVMDLVKDVKAGKVAVKELHETFCDKVKSDTLVMYARFLTAGYLKTNEILYESFLDEGMTIDLFCQREVEPIDRESDQLQIMALVSYLSIPVQIHYLDSTTKSMEPSVVTLPEDAKPETVFVKLVYRPGHYDILYQ